MPFATFRPALALTALLALAACSGDGPVASGDRLSDTERADVMDAFITLSGESLTIVGPALRADASASAALREEFDITFDCPAGGTSRIYGVVTVDESSGRTVGDLRQDFTLCGVDVASGRSVVLTGDPNVRTRYTWSRSQDSGQFLLDARHDGILYVEIGDRAARCSLQTTIRSDRVGEEAVVVNGTLCGRPTQAIELFL